MVGDRHVLKLVADPLIETVIIVDLEDWGGICHGADGNGELFTREFGTMWRDVHGNQWRLMRTLPQVREAVKV